MIDIRLLRDDPDALRHAAKVKGMACDIDRAVELDARRRELETRFNDLRHEQKQAGEKIAKAPKDEKATLSQSMGKLKAEIKQIEEEKAAVDEELGALLLTFPLPPSPDTPVGKTEADNVELRTVGQPKRIEDFGFEFRDHVDLGQRLGLFDLERGVKLAGTRNYVLTGPGAMLHEAVLRLAWDLMMQRGFTPLTVPVLVTEKLMYGTGFFPLHRDEVYLAERDEKALVGTAEVPVTGLHADEILDADELPKTYVARSTCFRREAGAAGRDTRGLYRIHFFDKLEQVVICPADEEQADHWHQQILTNAEDLLQKLELPYRLVEVCTGDMGQGKYRMYDIETWMPSREMYSETHSASSFHDFQARRLNLRYRDENGKPQFCYTLNNTVVASPRILIPLIELNQNADGSITIPAALRPYMQDHDRIEPAS